jgi:hypothetical protein
VLRAERTLPTASGTRCVPLSSPIPTAACPSFRPWPATARPRALRLMTLPPARGRGSESACALLVTSANRPGARHGQQHKALGRWLLWGSKQGAQ